MIWYQAWDEELVKYSRVKTKIPRLLYLFHSCIVFSTSIGFKILNFFGWEAGVSSNWAENSGSPQTTTMVSMNKVSVFREISLCFQTDWYVGLPWSWGSWQARCMKLMIPGTCLFGEIRGLMDSAGMVSQYYLGNLEIGRWVIIYLGFSLKGWNWVLLFLGKRWNHREMWLFWPNFPPVFRLQLAGIALKVPGKDFQGVGEKVNVDVMPGLSLCFLVCDSVQITFWPETKDPQSGTCPSDVTSLVAHHSTFF